MGNKGYFLFALLGFLLSSQPALAKENQKAEQLYKQAITHFNTLDFKGSIKLLETATRLTEDGKLLSKIHFYLSYNHLVTGNMPAAQGAMQQALIFDPLLELDPMHFKPEIIELYRDVRHEVRGQLLVKTDGIQAQIKIDGQLRGEAPLTLKLPVGKYQLRVEGQAHTVFQRQVVVSYQKTTRILAPLSSMQGTLTLQTTPPGAEVYLKGRLLGVTPLTKVAIAAGKQDLLIKAPGCKEKHLNILVRGKKSVALTVALESAIQKRKHRIWTWVAAGSAALFATVGIALGASIAADKSDYEANEVLTDQRLDEMEASISSKAKATTAMFALAGVFAVGAVALYFYEHRLFNHDSETNAARQPPQARRSFLRRLWVHQGNPFALEVRF